MAGGHLLVLVAASACGSPPERGPAPDAPDRLDCSNAPGGRLVAVMHSGVVTGKSASIPLAPTAEGNLLIVSIAYEGQSSFFPEVSVADGTETLQIAMSSSPCGMHAVDWAVGSIGSGTTSLQVTSGQPGTFVVFVARFDGLPVAAGAGPGRWAWSKSAAGAVVDACPGSAIMTTTISCAPLALADGNPFTMIDSVQGMAAAAYVPAERGAYGATWEASAESSSMTIAFP